jgi:hypothetical protein
MKCSFWRKFDTHDANSPQKEFPGATARNIVEYFFNWKMSAASSKWKERNKLKRKREKAKERAQLHRLIQYEYESDESDYHNSYCEICFTCGKLLCCDGCERAYHLSCLDPPMLRIPDEDWFCTFCAAILGTETIIRDGGTGTGYWTAAHQEETLKNEREYDTAEESDSEAGNEDLCSIETVQLSNNKKGTMRFSELPLSSQMLTEDPIRYRFSLVRFDLMVSGG